MANTVTCTGRAFRGLRDPYTGEPLVVKMVALRTGEARFFAPGAYSPRERFATRAEAHARWMTAEGIEGVRRGQPIVCAYTGERLVPAHDAAGFYFDGGFDPRVPRSRDEFLYYATMRGGVSRYERPGAPSRVSAVHERPDRQVLSHEAPMLEGSLERAEAAMKKSGFAPQRKTRVSMSVGKGASR